MDKIKIPLILHQTWKNNGPTKYDKYVKSWKSIKWLKRKFYDDNDIDNYIKLNFPEYYDFFSNKINKVIEKVDFFRYAVLCKEGGIYADMDTEILNPKLLYSLLKNKIVLGYENTMGRKLISQAVLISEKNNKFWYYLMNFIKKNYHPSKYPPNNTGPDIVSSFIKIYGNQFILTFCSQIDSGPIITHHKTGVWRSDQLNNTIKVCLLCRKNYSLCNCYKGNWFTKLIYKKT